eukprot:scaffold16839_cov247-Isochrysis_galbana.AAC.2
MAPHAAVSCPGVDSSAPSRRVNRIQKLRCIGVGGVVTALAAGGWSALHTYLKISVEPKCVGLKCTREDILTVHRTRRKSFIAVLSAAYPPRGWLCSSCAAPRTPARGS